MLALTVVILQELVKMGTLHNFSISIFSHVPVALANKWSRKINDNVISYHFSKYCIDPRGRPIVTAGRDHCFCTCRPHIRPSYRTSVRPHFSKQNKLQAKTMFATGQTVGLAEWIIDDTCLVNKLSRFNNLVNLKLQRLTYSNISSYFTFPVLYLLIFLLAAGKLFYVRFRYLNIIKLHKSASNIWVWYGTVRIIDLHMLSYVPRTIKLFYLIRIFKVSS